MMGRETESVATAALDMCSFFFNSLIIIMSLINPQRYLGINFVH